MTGKTTRFALTITGLLCLAGHAHAGKLADLLGSQGLKDAGTTAMTGLTLTDAQVIELGAKSVAQMDQDNPVASADNAYAKRLAKLASGMEREDGLKLNFKVYLVKDVNAFAVPDGSVRVFAGLMDLMPDDAELLSVIGHEIGHVKYGHSKEHYRAAYLSRAARKGVAAIGGTVGKLASSDIGAIGEAAVNAKFSRANETQADEYGVDFLRRHNLDPNAAVRGMQKLAAQDGKAKTSFLDDHPASQERVSHLQKYIARKK
ncbi:M48 family metallopeptidase [Lysobacter arvi]|uniref:M48 family metallopeptidase n=1 Tax=Lysobacter arvi TaxID=3038776 RepID=A0ABU1CDK4_9GAMM|nr:M48 family metallopeptidase [Lysobacter arvi]MDR0182484.1 M48 family metallopeptidase [Lysobacter arvi]